MQFGGEDWRKKGSNRLLNIAIYSLYSDCGVPVYFFQCCLMHVWIVSGRYRSPGGVKTAAGDMFERVLIKFHPNQTTVERNVNKELNKLTRLKLMSMEV